MARAARHLEMRMLNPLFALSFEAARFGLEMQSVVALRLMRLMGGSEARGSVSEKMATETGNLTVDMHQRTTVENLYAAGDIVSDLHQIAVAAGHAAIAATSIHNNLAWNPR